MVLHLKLGASFIKGYKRNGMIYLPDFIIYDIDAEEYQTFWNELKTHPKNQLYTDGVQVYKVSWLAGIFQRFKGWLGFENRCDPNRVELTLAKIAYYGYLRGYNAKETVVPLISPQFQNLISAHRTNQHSASLQQLMMSHYITVAESFPIDVEQAYPFGETLINERLFSLFPEVDPQDKAFIAESIPKMYSRANPLSFQSSLKGYQFTTLYAEFLLSLARYEEAKQWWPEIVSKHKKQYIEFYLYLKSKSSGDKAIEEAMKLIAELDSSLNEEERKEAMEYISYFTIAEQLRCLGPYPNLRKKIAKGYIVKAEEAFNPSTWRQLMPGYQDLSLDWLNQAARFDPTLLDHAETLQIPALKEKWIKHLFNQAIQNQNFIKAKALFEQNAGVKFDKNVLTSLKTYYLEEINHKKAQIKNALMRKDCDSALKIAQECKEIAKHISDITPEQHPRVDCTVEHAQVLLTVDEIHHPTIKEADLRNLQRAQEMLQEVAQKQRTSTLKSVLNYIIERQINCLIERIRVPTLFKENSEIREEFMATNRGPIDALQRCLTTYISLNEGVKGKEERRLLAKAHFLKGDIIYFYERNVTACRPHYNNAIKVRQENFYYRFHYYDLIKDRSRCEKAREQISNVSSFHMEHYQMWMEERWDEERVASEGVDIHRELPEEPSRMERFRAKFSS